MIHKRQKRSEKKLEAVLLAVTFLNFRTKCNEYTWQWREACALIQIYCK